LQVRWRSFNAGKSHQHWEFGDASLNPAKDFDFAFPSLGASGQIALNGPRLF
jgi:hypothetical protein